MVGLGHIALDGSKLKANVYDEMRDTYVCPEGKDLEHWTEQRLPAPFLVL